MMSCFMDIQNFLQVVFKLYLNRQDGGLRAVCDVQKIIKFNILLIYLSVWGCDYGASLKINFERKYVLRYKA